MNDFNFDNFDSLTEVSTPLGTVTLSAEPGQVMGTLEKARCTADVSPGHASGAVFSNEQILQKILQLEAAGKLFGIFPDIPAAVYNDFRFPGVRSSDLKEIIKTSFERWEMARGKPKDISDALNFGSAFHAVMADEPTEEFNLNMKERSLLRLMGSSVRSHPKVNPVRRDSKNEITFFATCPITNLLLRCRCDLWHEGENFIADWKTCRDAAPGAFAQDAKKYGYKISAAFYMKVFRLVVGVWPTEFRIFACEKEQPWGIGTYSYSLEDCEDTQLEIDVGLQRIKTARDGGWKSYDMEPRRLRY